MNTPPRNPAPRPSRLTPYALRLLLLVLAARFAWEILHALDVFADYHAYYRAAANLRAGADIYAEGKLLVARNSFDFWTQTDGQYVYPPALAIALLPLTILDIGKGSPVWLLILVLATLAFIWLAARTFGHPVGLYSYLLVALPTWATLPLALGIRYNLVAPLSVALATVALAAYLVASLGPLRHHLSAALPALIASLPSPRRGYPPQWVRSPQQQRGEVKPRARTKQSTRISTTVPLSLLALPLLAALILAFGWRNGQIDAFLLKLAAPGLVGTTLLPFMLASRATSLRADFDALLPIAIPVVGATPLLLGIRFGQPDILLLLLTTLALLAHLRRRDLLDLLAGIALGAAAAVKPTLALYGLYYVKKRAWTTLAAAALTGATLGLAPFLVLGRPAFADWLAVSRYFTGDDYPAYPNNQSLRGLLLRAFAGGPQHAPLLVNRFLADALWLLAVAAALLLWWWFVSTERAGTPRAAAEYALTAALILFAAPLSEDIHHVALLLPLALLADQLFRAVHPPRWRILAALALLAFIFPLPDLAERITGPPLPHLLASAPYLYGLILVVAALLTAGFRERRQPAS